MQVTDVMWERGPILDEKKKPQNSDETKCLDKVTGLGCGKKFNFR